MAVLTKKPKVHFNLLGADDYFFNKSYKSSFFDFLPSIRLINISMDKIYNDFVLEKQYSDNSEMFIITKNIIEQFHSEVVLNNSIPLIILFPNKWDVLELMRGNKLRYLGLLKFLRKTTCNTLT